MLYDKRWERTETKTEPWRKVLLNAADLIETNGWCQEAYEVGGKHCAVGAMRQVVGLNPDHDPRDCIPSNILSKAILKLAIYLKTENIEAWNDLPTQEDWIVVNVLREVASA